MGWERRGGGMRMVSERRVRTNMVWELLLLFFLWLAIRLMIDRMPVWICSVDEMLSVLTD